MNWGEFKKAVESQGITDDWDIDFIDWGGISALLEKLNVYKDEEEHEFSVT